MGTFYGSILIRTEDFGAVQGVLDAVAKQTGRKFLAGPPLNGWISVFPDQAGQSDASSAEIAKRLPEDIFHLVVHDDDIFSYYFYRGSRLVDRYNSCPDYFETAPEEEKQACRGRPELFQDLLPKPESLIKLKALLTTEEGKFTFEQERMGQFVELAGWSNALSSYEYLQDGEREGIKGWKQFVHIPDLNPEKAAKKAAKARVVTEKKRLKKEGILLAEIEPTKKKGSVRPRSFAWGTDTNSNGLLLVLKDYHRAPEDEGVEFQTIQPPWDKPLQSISLKTNGTAHIFSTSPSGKWLAGGFVAGDWKMRVWDWQNKKLAFEVTHTHAVQWVSFSPDEQLIYSLGGEFTVTSKAAKGPIITIKNCEGARTAAVHPSGKFVAVVFQADIGIFELGSEKPVKRLRIEWGTKKIDRFPKTSDELAVQQVLGNPAAMKQLRLESAQQVQAWVKENRFIEFKSQEHPFDLCFSPDGEQLILATSPGTRVYGWNKLLAANDDTPPPEFSIDAPNDDETNPNSHPLTYCVRFDPDRNIVLSSCLAGVVQYLNVKNGESGELLKLPGEVSVWRMELTSDRKALCCQGGSRPNIRNQKEATYFLQVWNYPALCAAAGLD